MLYSSTDEMLRTLAREMPPERAEAFLRELVNLRDEDPDSVSRFCERFLEYIPGSIDWRKESAAASNVLDSVDERVLRVGQEQETREQIKHTRRDIGYWNLIKVWHWQTFLQQAWKQPTVLEREMSLNRPLFLVQENFYKVCAANPPEGSESQAARRVWGRLVVALSLARRMADRMRYCVNPTCPAPYFIAKRRSQKYCSEKCTAPAQREFKAAWWKEHGEKWRAGRMKKAARKRHGGKARQKGGN
jgi:hypothetical protein